MSQRLTAIMESIGWLSTDSIEGIKSTVRYNRKLCMKGKSVSYVGSSHLTWTRRGPKRYAHGQDYRKSGRSLNDFGIGVGIGSVDPGRSAENAPIRFGQ